MATAPAGYQLTADPNVILRTADSALIPVDGRNTDYLAYLDALSGGALPQARADVLTQQAKDVAAAKATGAQAVLAAVTAAADAEAATLQTIIAAAQAAAAAQAQT
jgi:hypothetical protein